MPTRSLRLAACGPVSRRAEALQALVVAVGQHAGVLVRHDKHVRIVLRLALPAVAQQQVRAHTCSAQKAHRTEWRPGLHSAGRGPTSNGLNRPVAPGCPGKPAQQLPPAPRRKHRRQEAPFRTPDAARLPIVVVDVHAARMP